MNRSSHAPSRSAIASVLCATLCSFVGACGQAPPGLERGACDQIITVADAGRLDARLRRLDAGSCRWRGVQTRASEVVAAWDAGAGDVQVTILPSRCAAGPGVRVGDVSVLGLRSLVEGCPGLGERVVAAVTAAAVAPEAPRGEPEAAPWRSSARQQGPTLEAVWVRYVLPAVWVLLLLLAAGWGARALVGRRLGALEAWVAGAIVAGAATRLLWARPGPGDLYNTLEEAYLGAGAIDGVGLYGRGVEALLLLLFRVAPAGDDTVIAADLAAGLLSIAALAWLARRLGYPARVAGLAAWLLAVAPLHVRYSVTVNRYSLLILLVLMGWGWLLGWLRVRSRLQLVLATLSLSLAAQCRPDAVPLVPILTLALLGAWWWPRRQRWRPGPELLWAVVVAAAVAGLPLWRVVSLVVAEPYGNTGPLLGTRELFSPDRNAFLSHPYTPALWGVVALFGLRRPPAGDRWLLAWLVLAALLPTWLASMWAVDPNLNTARYHLLPLPFYLIVTAAGWSWLQGRQAAAAAAALILLAAVPLASTLAPRMLDDEYRFLRDHLAQVPDGCALFTPEPAAGEDLGLRPSFGLSLSAGREHHWVQDLEGAAAANPRCVVYYRSGSCNLATSRRERRLWPACEALRARSLGVIAESRVTDRSSEGRPVLRPGTTVGLYWMTPPPR